MGNHASLHPTEQTLSDFSLGKLADGRAEIINNHLNDCPDCQRLVAEMSSDSFLGRLQGVGGRLEPVPAVGSSLAGLSRIAGEPASAEPPLASSLPPGLANHPDYEIVRELGQGGMGTVYLAQNRLMGRNEVLKVVSGHLIKRRGVLDRFLVEIRNAARLHHTNIVTAYSASRLEESFIFAMEYVEGLDLSKLVKAKGPLPVAHACNYVHQACLGLQHAHEQGMVHRDIKPSNLMLARQGKRAVIKVLDFGLAKIQSEGPMDGGLTHEGQMLGTPDYIAPEQIRDARGSDIRADIYSMGCTMYYLLTGGPPFQATSLYDLLQAHHSMDAMPLNLARPEVPVELAAIVAKMMAKEPGRRFQEPKEVAQALMPFFKKGSPGSVGSKPEVSRAGQTNTSRLVSSPTQPATDTGGSAAPDKEVAKPTAAETGWESLIDVQKEGRSKKPTPAVDPDQRRPWKKWRIAMAASLFGVIVLGGIIIRILDKDGHEIGKVEVPKGGSFVAQDSGDKGGSKPPENGRGDVAGPSSPVSAARVAGSPMTAPTEPLQAGTFWRGTSTVLYRSWTNGAAKPRALWLTIKGRKGTQFNAVAESPRGWHDAEGKFKDGVINWKVDGENLSWEGKLDRNELVGTFKGTNWQGDQSGVFRLTLADGTRPTVLPAGIPLAGPARGASYVKGGEWIVEGDQLIKEGLADGLVLFGDGDWTDYDLTYQARKSAGPEGFGGAFRTGTGRTYFLSIGDSDGRHKLSQWTNSTRQGKLIQSVRGTIQPLKWYTVKISLRAKSIRIELDGQVIISCTDDFSQKGFVSLRFYNGAGRFRNIKVTAPDGTKLWEGPPDLP